MTPVTFVDDSIEVPVDLPRLWVIFLTFYTVLDVRLEASGTGK